MRSPKGPLKDKGFLDPEVMERARKIMEETRQTDIAKVLLSMKLVGEQEILQSKAQEMGMAFADLDRVIIDPRALDSVPKDLSRELRALPVKRDGNTLWIAFAEPNSSVARRIAEATGLRVIPVLSERQALDDALARL